MSAGSGISLRIRQADFYRRASLQISRPATEDPGDTMVIREQRFSIHQVRQVLGSVLDHDLHAKRVGSLCGATLGVLRSGSLAICTIGQGLAAARGVNPKHATKQVDRLLSNPKINVDDILARWVPYIIGARRSIVVALDWTDFDADKQATIMLFLITDHGRATPLVWLTVDKRTLKDNRSLYEQRVLVRLAELLPPDIEVCVVADRGFGDQKLYRMLTEELCFDYVIRFRGNIAVTATTGETRTAAAWVRPSGRARVLRGAAVTADRYPVGTVICVQDPDMKQAWCLAASSAHATAKHLTGYYGRRWGIDIDQAWRLSRIKGWVGSICNEVFWVEHRGSVFSSVRIRAADRQAIADQRGRAVPARRRGVRRVRCRQDWRASCRAIPDIGRGSP